MTKTERWLNLLAFLLDRRYAVPREEILSQVDDYKADWLAGDDKIRESVRRKFERDTWAMVRLVEELRKLAA